MRKINQEHQTAVVLVTHDLAVAAEFCDEIAVMYAGRVVEQGPVEEVVRNPHHPYTQGLLGCRPRITEKGQKVMPIPGNVPDVINLPPGCAFAPRCPLKCSACEQGPIPLFQVGENQFNRCLAQVNFKSDPAWSWDNIVRV
jgi:oligopeptide/dipeptide ABC transporter ATP-binding protein